MDKMVMKSIRIGKDISVRWAILTNGQPISLEGRDLKLVLTNPLKRTTEPDFTVSGNEVSATIQGTEQKYLGSYSLTLWENYGKQRQTAIDACEAFRLVATTCQEGGTDEGLDTETVNLSGTLEVFTQGGGGGEVNDYNVLINKPHINNVELKGNKSLEELGIQPKGDYVTEDEIPDVSNFITNTVDNLVNYYKKSETYTQSEVNNLLGQVTTINLEVVDNLPPTGEENKIYLVKRKQKADTDDVYDEYIWIKKDNKYEPIGSTSVDLSNYYNKSEADNKFALKVDIADMLTKMEAERTYAKKGDIPDVSGFITETDADKKYQTKGDYALKSDLTNKADNVATENVSEDTKELQPNRYYIFGEVANLTITLVSGEFGKLSEYMFEFTSGTTPTTLNLPESVKWIGDNTIEASKTYQVSIVNNLAVMGGAS